MATYINGQSGKVSVGATDIDVESWQANAQAEALDTTTTGSNGWEENITGIKSIEGSFKTFWDTAAVPTAATPGLTPGASATLKLYVGNSNKFLTGTGRITKVTPENPAKGVVGFSVDFKGTGSWTFPS